MTKKKNQKKAVAQAKKSVVDTLRFQTHWGLKQLGHEDGNMFHKFVDVEVDFIAEHESCPGFFTEMERVKEILSDTHGMLLWKEQEEEIIAYIDSLSNEDKDRYSSAIKIVIHEIELRQHSLSNRKFFRNRSLICYKLAYIKAHIPDDFERLRAELCN